MKKLSILMLALLLVVNGFAQDFEQTLRGKVVDSETNAPLIGANVVLVDSDPFVGASTGLDGSFSLENVALGRYDLLVTYLGYEARTIRNILVQSGKETVLKVQLEEALTKLNEVTISAKQNKGETVNKMVSVSARAFTTEETKRYAGSLDDPARMASAFAGVTPTDLNNDLVIRGNTPMGMLWRMEGLEIPNPNHFSDQGATGGAISILSSNMMTTSDFLTGAFPSEYGNATSGVFDIHLRKGNNRKREYAFQVGVLGTDFAVEGPFKKGYEGSYLINYRYSTLAMINLIGIDVVGDAVPKFQDLSWNIDLPAGKLGNFNLFGFAGDSKIEEKWPVDSLYFEDIFASKRVVAGMGHSKLLGKKTLWKNTLGFTGSNSQYYSEQFDSNKVFMFTDENEDFTNTTYRFTTNITHKFNARHTLKVGAIGSVLGFDFANRYYDQELDSFVVEHSQSGETRSAQAYAQWQLRLSKKITINSGFHINYFDLNQETSFEPRLGAIFKIDDIQSINAGFGVHSKSIDLATYFAEATDANGNKVQPNMNLDMIKSNHYVLGYNRILNENTRLRVEAYYQTLYDVPVDDTLNGRFSALNSFGGFTNVALVNEGTGTNYGLEFTLERDFENNLFYMATVSLFQSKYKAKNGVEYNSRFNSNYLSSFQIGKEFPIRGNVKKVFGTTIKGVYAGSNRTTPILLDESIAAGETVLDNTRPWEGRVSDYWRADVQVFYRWNRPKATHTVKLDVQNATNHENAIREYYNPMIQEIETATQLGILPILSYKIQF